ncbi:hypothetical protein CROQUDRAFT_713927 [Cronartium quercuum f. sp. fusiforme G11]|uniref:Secreted protein n=1 Tax=Cronartium quercuum f. sp. fusiforme G11 TaxID=708437 RepID=A0A9P6TEG0_9BASI|nr:hypothetical protein CROQUDRAFT_713927 [Cronartium quercuum f. sp. fusiforme G11]
MAYSRVYLLVGLLIVLSDFQTIAKSKSLQTRSIPIADAIECVNGAVAQTCMNSVNRGWNATYFRQFKRTPMVYIDQITSCTIKYWSNDLQTIQLENVDQIKAALLQIDQTCLNYKLPSKTCMVDRRDSRGLFIGLLSGHSVTISLTFSPQTYAVGQCDQ